METVLVVEKSKFRWILILIACACGLIVANLYYAQPLVDPISIETGISAASSGLIVTMTQLGYALGLLFIVPLSDLIENRRLIVSTLTIAISGLILAILVKNSVVFFIAAVLIGLGSVAAQILVPFAAYLSTEEDRGKTIGNVMSGLLLGIMLARPVASFITGIWSWKAVFFISSIIIAFLIVFLEICLPVRKPATKNNYISILKSMLYLFKTMTVLRRRALYQAALFGSFSLFWTVAPLWLIHHFKLTQQGIAVFAFVGVAGAVAAPLAGRLADRGLTKKLTGIAFVLAASAFAITHIIEENHLVSLMIFAIAAILLDMAVSGNLVLGQQAIYGLGDEIRGRVNGIFMAVFFMGGAIGSALGGWAYAVGGWGTASLIGFTLPILAFIYYATEK